MRKILPIWKQTFSVIRESGNVLYVDKTEHIYRMLTEAEKSVIFLSRPRRFGKSLFCSTLKSLFKGEKQYFKGLYIEDKWNWEEKNPVIHIMFGTGIVEDKEYLKWQLESIINKNARDNEIKLEEKSIQARFEELIEKIYKKTWKQVAVIIDEYDKPILDRIHETELAVDIREELKSFYSVLKNADEYLRFVFITWVSKFSQVSLFSGLNQIKDITFDLDYATICGMTEEEIENNFGPEWYLEWVDRKELKKWYNGYNFNCRTEEEKVYNPFWLLNFFGNNKEYNNYWFRSATPSFLIRLLEKNSYPTINFENITGTEKMMDAFEIENIELITLMFQTGYLTIKDKKTILGWKLKYTLWIPNYEVRQSLNDYLISDYFGFKDNHKNFEKIDKLDRVLKEGDIEWLIEVIKSIFAGIPYANYVKNEISKYEWFYSSVLYSFLTWSGVDFIAEDFTNRGRIDFTMQYVGNTYIVELKVEKTWKEALEQIQEKWYEEKYRAESKEIYLIWLNFSEEEKNVESWNYTTVKKENK